MLTARIVSPPGVIWCVKGPGRRSRTIRTEAAPNDGSAVCAQAGTAAHARNHLRVIPI